MPTRNRAAIDVSFSGSIRLVAAITDCTRRPRQFPEVDVLDLRPDASTGAHREYRADAHPSGSQPAETSRGDAEPASGPLRASVPLMITVRWRRRTIGGIPRYGEACPAPAEARKGFAVVPDAGLIFDSVIS